IPLLIAFSEGNFVMGNFSPDVWKRLYSNKKWLIKNCRVQKCSLRLDAWLLQDLSITLQEFTKP
ncbi:MAG: hypothetical protein RMK35_06685, partial [Aquificaceae bacterium]|nr:hypothetical protein [Aquificaceae bacterium]